MRSLAADSSFRPSGGLLVLSVGLLVCACSVGAGKGEVSGTVNAPGCGMDDESYELKPSFFAAQAIEEKLVIRIQRGADFEDKSDGVVVQVANASDIKKNRLGTDVSLAPGPNAEADVRLTLYLNETCPVDRESTPVAYDAMDGTIRFERIYAPELDEDDLRTTAVFSDVLLVDPESPDERNARIDGSFSFLFTRGRPAQRFP